MKKMKKVSMLVVLIFIVATFLATSASTEELLVDSDFKASTDSADLRTDSTGQDWYESRNDLPALLTLDTNNVGGNSGKKAALLNHGIANNAYLTQEFSSAQSDTFDVSFDIYIDSIEDSGTYDRTAHIYIGDDRIGTNAPTGSSDERFVLMAFYDSTPGDTGDDLEIRARTASGEAWGTTSQWASVATGLSYDTWYDLKIVLDIATGTYDVYVDDVLEGDDIAKYSGYSPGSVELISFVADSDGRGNFSVDNVIAQREVNYPPTHDDPLLTSELGTDTTNQDLICTAQNVDDPEEDDVYLTHNWYKDATSLTNLNLPFNLPNADDYSGYNNDGTINGATWTSSGVIGGAYGFDGVDDYILIPSDTTLDGGWSEMTMEVWVNVDVNQTQRIILAKWGPSSPDRSYEIGIDTNGNTQLFAAVDNGAYLETLYSDVDPLTPGTWYHVAATYSGGVLDLYINGVLGATRSNAGGNIRVSSDSLKIGARNPTPERFFDGKIDEVKIYSFALTPEQIYQSYLQSKDGFSTETKIVSEETSAGDEWQCEVTPSDLQLDGETKQSNTLTILAPGCIIDDDCGLCEKCVDEFCEFQSLGEDLKNECPTVSCDVESCDGAGACQDYTGDEGYLCEDDCTYCDTGSCVDRAQCDATECTGQERCNAIGGDCADPDTDSDVCTICYSAVFDLTMPFETLAVEDCCDDDSDEYYVTKGVGAPACCDGASENCVDSGGVCRDEYPTEVTCDDGIDNDCDGDIDTADSDCIVAESTVTRSFSDDAPDQCSELTVSLTIDINDVDRYYAIDEVPPAGWTISDSGSGATNESGHIKWIVFQDAVDTVYEYKVMVPCDALGIYTFEGTYMFENYTEEQTILGSTNVDVQEVECLNDYDCGLCEKCTDNVCVSQSDSEDLKDQCAEGSCVTSFCDGEGACDFKPDNTVCENAFCDSLTYNLDDTCQSGICTDGGTEDCNPQADSCNDATCGATTGCGKDPKADGIVCLDAFCDGLTFNSADTCLSGACVDSGTEDCNPQADSCNDATCGATTGCGKDPKADGTVCNDEEFCSVNDVCTAGKCGGAARNCSDGYGCTVDTCDDGINECVNNPDHGYCGGGVIVCNPFIFLKPSGCGNGICTTGADLDYNGDISMPEIMNYIGEWKASEDEVGMIMLMDAIGKWKTGAGC